MIDPKQPVRLVKTKERVNYIGPRSDGTIVIEYGQNNALLRIVKEEELENITDIKPYEVTLYMRPNGERYIAGCNDLIDRDDKFESSIKIEYMDDVGWFITDV